MLALKKKREADAADAASGAPKVNLLGVGGNKVKSSSTASAGKKRSPGEIRIQKGKNNSKER
jgi:hypothetical protein